MIRGRRFPSFLEMLFAKLMEISKTLPVLAALKPSRNHGRPFTTGSTLVGEERQKKRENL
jgi:hypothetical protein